MGNAYRTGETWSGRESQLVLAKFKQGRSIEKIARDVGRTELAIKCRLQAMGEDTDKSAYDKQPIASTLGELGPTVLTGPSTEEQLMQNRTVTTKTFVGNIDASSLNTEQLIEVIEKEQEFIDRIVKLPASTARVSLLEKHKGNLEELNKLLEASL